MFFHHSTANADAKLDVGPELSVLQKGGPGATRTTNPRAWLFLFDEEPETCKREMKLQWVMEHN